MLSLVENLLEITPTISSVSSNLYFPWIILKPYKQENMLPLTFIFFQGDRCPFVMETVKADDNAKMGMYGFSLKTFRMQF